MSLPALEDSELIHASWITLGAKDWKDEDHTRLFDLLIKHGLVIGDLPRVFLHAAAAPCHSFLTR
jgi:hypothetical protein